MNCPYCGAKAVLRNSSEVFSKPKYNEMMWVCSNYPNCDAYVGCHKGTSIPLGRLANQRLRNLKKEAHRQFDPIWKSGLMSRKEAYRWLADMLHIPCDECHIGMFDIKMCQKVIAICKKQNNPTINKYKGEEKRPMFTLGYPSKTRRIRNKNKH